MRRSQGTETTHKAVLNPSMIRVINVLLACPDDQGAWGVWLAEQADVATGNIYDMLHTFVNRGWLVKEQEATNPRDRRRQPRSFYRFNGEAGREAARDAVEQQTLGRRAYEAEARRAEMREAERVAATAAWTRPIRTTG